MPFTRLDLGYQEVPDDAPERCGTCRHLSTIVLPDRLGTCGLYKALHEKNPERWHLREDVGLHEICSLWEGKTHATERGRNGDTAALGEGDGEGRSRVEGTGSVHSGQPEDREGNGGGTEDQIALAGQDGKKAEELLRKAKADGREVLAEITRSALKRLLNSGPQAARRKTAFLNDKEKKRLAAALAATNATAELLGRARIRLRQQRAERFAEADYDDDAHPFEQFDEASGIQPLAPEAAVDYFRSLVPTLHIDPQRFGWEQRRDAFTLAGQTDKTLLERIQEIIGKALETGQKVSAAPAAIDQVLDEAGVSSANPQYAEMVFRTNMMDAYQTGSDQERMRPDVIETFPVWRYIGIRDGRQGKDHEPHFDRYYPAHISFAEVRGPRVFNCRCSSVPVSKWKWAKLRAEGARLAAA